LDLPPSYRRLWPVAQLSITKSERRWRDAPHLHPFAQLSQLSSAIMRQTPACLASPSRAQWPARRRRRRRMSVEGDCACARRHASRHSVAVSQAECSLTPVSSGKMTDFWPRGTSWSFAWRCRWRSMGVGPSGQGLLLMMHGRNLEDDTGLVRRIHISRQDASARTGSSLQLLPSVPALRHASCRQPGSTGRPPNLDNARVREARAGHGPGRSQMSFGGCVASSKASGPRCFQRQEPTAG